jgi:hypothetical protein
MALETKIIKSHCNQCGHKTRHFVRAEHTVRDSEDVHGGQYTVEWGSRFSLLECCGCSDVSLIRRSWCSETDDDEIVIFPPRVSRRKPVFFDKTPEEYRFLLEEIYTALHSDSRCLAMMGARTVIDRFIVNKVGDRGDFCNGMSALMEDGYLSRKDKEIIEAAIEVGHAASHRAYVPSGKDVTAVMDIVENMLHHDLLAESAEKLRKTTPPRPQKVKKPKK